jgi:hypothetical protein
MWRRPAHCAATPQRQAPPGRWPPRAPAVVRGGGGEGWAGAPAGCRGRGALLALHGCSSGAPGGSDSNSAARPAAPAAAAAATAAAAAPAAHLHDAQLVDVLQLVKRPHLLPALRAAARAVKQAARFVGGRGGQARAWACCLLPAPRPARWAPMSTPLCREPRALPLLRGCGPASLSSAQLSSARPGPAPSVLTEAR